MAHDLSKGLKRRGKIGFLDRKNGLSGTKYGPNSPFVPRNNSKLLAEYFENESTAGDSSRLLDTSRFGTRRTGQQGRCIDLNGTNQAVRVADNTALDITDNLTVCVWAKNNNALLGSVIGILNKGDLVNKREWYFGLTGDEKIIVAFGDSDGAFVGTKVSDDAPTLNEFNHYVFTFYGGVVEIYLNGVNEPSTTTGAIPVNLNNEDGGFSIGGLISSGALQFFWDGQVFDARIYAGESTVLTAAQILSIYEDGANNVEFAGQDLRANYKLDEGSGTTNYDSSGNENHGTIENAVSNWGVTQDVMSFQNQVGYNLSGAVYIPRDESDLTNDVLGNPLTYTGTRPNDAALINSSCLTADGTLYIAAAHLAGTETVVRSGGTSTPSISAGRIDFTAGTCWDLLLSDGTHYKLAHAYGTAILDSSGAGSHGILTSATLASAWGATQNDYHSNLIDGCSKRMWFNGISNDVILGPSSDLITDISNFYIEAKFVAGFIPSDADARHRVFSLYRGTGFTNICIGLGGDNKIYVGYNNGSIFVNRLAFTGIALNSKYKIKISRSGTTFTFELNDVVEDTWTDTLNTMSSDNAEIGSNSLAGAIYFFDGLIYDLDFNGISIYNGYGNTDTDWVDVAGSNDGTVSGSAEAFYIPASTSALDVYGQSLTDPFVAGKRNRAETEINFNPDSTPEMENVYTESVFNGTTSHGYVTNNSVLNFTDYLTVSCWAKSDLSDVTSNSDVLVSMYESTGSLQVWRMEITTGEFFRFMIGNSGGTGMTNETADVAKPIDSWNHYAATFESGTVKLYINGELQSSSSSSAHAAVLNGRSAPLLIGAYNWSAGGGSQQEWDGSIRNVRIYKGDSSSLSNSQIVRDMMESESQPQFDSQTVIASYDLTKDTIDRSGNNLHATNNGITFTQKTLPSTYSFGDYLGDDSIINKTVKFDKVGWGATFDGSSYVNIGNRDKLRITTEPFEIEAEIKLTGTGAYDIFSKYQTASNKRCYRFYVSNGDLFFTTTDDGSTTATLIGSVSVNDGGWHRVKVVRETASSTSAKIYIDGVEDAGVAGSIDGSIYDANSVASIGAYNLDATPAGEFEGNIRDVKVTVNGVVVGEWELSKDAKDGSANDYHGTNTGVTFNSPDSEYSMNIYSQPPFGKNSQFGKKYNKSRLYGNS
jgi:hypothetical protein